MGEAKKRKVAGTYPTQDGQKPEPTAKYRRRYFPPARLPDGRLVLFGSKATYRTERGTLRRS
jgi:hypothetical protein